MSRDCPGNQQIVNNINNPAAELVGSGWAASSGTNWNNDEHLVAAVSEGGWGDD
jgi:hypothetical protein